MNEPQAPVVASNELLDFLIQVERLLAVVECPKITEYRDREMWNKDCSQYHNAKHEICAAIHHFKSNTHIQP